MPFSHFYGFSCLKILLFVVLALQLAACSGGDGGNIASGIDSSINPTGIDSNPKVYNVLGLTWAAPSEREDGTGLSLSEIAGYRIYYGTEAGDYQNKIDINDTSADQAQVTDLAVGTYYVVMTTIDTAGIESSYSLEVEIVL